MKTLRIICCLGLLLLYGCKCTTKYNYFDRDIRVYARWGYMPRTLQSTMCFFENNVFVENMHDFWEFDDIKRGDIAVGTYVKDGGYYYMSIKYLYCQEFDEELISKHFVMQELADDCLKRYLDRDTFLKENQVDSVWREWAIQNMEQDLTGSDYYLRIFPGHLDGKYTGDDISNIVNKY